MHTIDRCILVFQYENAWVCVPLLRTFNATLPMTSLIFNISKKCVCVCLYALVDVCVYAHVYVYAYVYICMRMCMQPSVSLCVCEYVCVCVHVRVYLGKRSQISVTHEIRDQKKGSNTPPCRTECAFQGVHKSLIKVWFRALF